MRKAKTGQNSSGAGFGGMSLNIRKADLYIANAVGIGGVLGFGQQGGALSISSQHRIQQAVIGSGGFLRHKA